MMKINDNHRTLSIMKYCLGFVMMFGVASGTVELLRAPHFWSHHGAVNPN